MIKQTRGALTMLLSVYRSVLKNAYLKNFAAVALAASVGIASADPVAPKVSESLELQNTAIELTDNAEITAGTENVSDANAAAATVNDINISNANDTTTLSITAKAGTNGTATLTVNEGKTLTVKKGGKVSLTGDTTQASESVIPNAATINGKIVLDAGDAEASTSVLEFANGRTVVGDVNVKNGTLTFTDGTASAKNITSDAKGKIAVASDKTMYVEKDLTLKDGATLSNEGSILTVGTATIGKLADGAKLGILAFGGKANFTQTDKLTIDSSDSLSIQSDADFAGNVDNKGSINLVKTSSLTVNGAEGLNNIGGLKVAGDADAKVNAKLKSSGTIEVATPITEGLVTKVAFADDVVNSGSITLNEGSDVTFAGALTNSKTVTSTGSLTVSGKLTNDAGTEDANTSTITLANAKLGEVDNTKGQITVSSKGNATFGKLNNASASSVTVAAGENANNKTVASFADVVNEGAITLGVDSDVSFKNLENKGTLDSSTALDLVDKLVNTGTVKVSAGTLKASLKNLGIGVAGAENVKVVNTATLDLGDKVELADNIFTNEDATKRIKNSGTIKAGTLTLNDTAEKSADEILTNSGMISVDTLNLNKGLASAANLTVAKAVSTEGTEATLGSTSSAVNLVNDGKVNGTVSGFKSVVAKITGLWDLGKADLDTEDTTIDNATVSNVGVIKNAKIGSTKKATVTATTVKAATLSNESVLNAGKVDAIAAADAPIKLDASTLNVGDITVTVGTDPAHAAISATAGSTVKITGEYKAVAKGLVANLDGSTLVLEATAKNTSGDNIATIKGDDASTLVINGISGPVKLSTNKELNDALTSDSVVENSLAALYKKIGVDGTNFTGQVKGFSIDTSNIVNASGQVELGKLGNVDDSFGTIASSTDAFATAQVTGVNGTALASKLNVGSILADNGTATVGISTGDITLNTAKDGLLVAQAAAPASSDKPTEANVNFTGAGKLTLNGNGKVGNIDADAAGNGTLSVNANVEAGKIGESHAIKELTVSSGTLTAKSVNAQKTTVDGGLTLTKNTLTTASGALVTTGALTTGKNAVVTAENISVGDNSSLSGKVTVNGNLTVAEDKTLDIGEVTGGVVDSYGTVTVNQLKAASGSIGAVSVNAGSLSVTGDTATTLSAGLIVGKAGAVSFAKDVTLDTTASTIEGSLSANVLTANAALSVNGGGKVNVDVLTGTGVITVGKDVVPNGTGSIYAKTLKAAGTITIDPEFGQKASFVGAEHFATDAEGVEEAQGSFLVEKNSALAVGVSSEEQARAVLSSLGLTDANGSFRENGVKNAIYTDALVKLKSTTGITVDSGVGASVNNGVITLGDKSAVVIGKNAAAQSVKDRKAVLTADKADGAGVVIAGDKKSTVIFAGNATKQDIKDVKVFGNAGAGNQVFANADEAAKVSVQLSPLYNEAKLTVDGGITDITVNRGYINKALYNASLPVKDLVAEVADTALTGDGVGSDFIMENALVDGGANIESAARLATFGGAYQAAAAAVNTGIDAAQARLGLGIDNSAEVKGEDISVWANAVYKNTESDSFEAQGANYGADLDLTSLVIGADYNMAEGSKVGAYATFGTGDVDGKGAGHNVKNDVDTYGFGIYGSAKLASGVSILSDVGYTVAQNEFKGIVNADADMKVFTAGANVKYTFNTQVADITPFVGARYTSFNLESYAVKSAKGIVAYTDADTAHIFSIPVGFDLSKQITAGEWNVKPAFTAKVTFNTGDKTVSSSTQFTGVKNTLNLDAEVMDDVTYSVGASVSAAKGAATFGAGLSYTGSSETNELSAQIGARYTF